MSMAFLVILIIFYGVGGIVWAICWLTAYNDGYGTDRKACARMFLGTPIYPLLIAGWMVRALFEIIATAFGRR